MELTSSLTLEMLGKPFLLEKRIRLLHAIVEHGSISKAAKTVPMSYKSAWEAVDMMNNLAPEAIVERETGGKNGGGTTVTAYGRQLLETYSVLKLEHEKFLEKLSALPHLKNGDIQTIGRLSLQISARNQIQGKIMELVFGEVHAKVKVKLKSGNLIYSIITKEAAENLGLYEGEDVTVIFKSSSVKLLKNRRDGFEAQNIFEGRVVKRRVDEERVEMSIDIGASEMIVLATKREYVQGDFAEESRVFVQIDENNVMVGK